MIKKVLGIALVVIAAAFLVPLVVAIVRNGVRSWIGTVALGAGGIAALLEGIKLIRERPRSSTEQPS